MVSTEKRPIPAPRTTLIGRKPAVPKRGVEINFSNSHFILPSSRECFSQRNNILTFQRQLSSSNNFHRANSLSDIRNRSVVSVRRSASFHLCICSVQKNSLTSNNSGKKWHWEGVDDSNDSHLHSGYNSNTRFSESGHVARITKMINSANSQSTSTFMNKPVVSSTSKMETANVQLPVVKSCCSLNRSTITTVEDSNKDSSSFNETGNQKYDNTMESGSVPAEIPRCGLWNSGYIGLEAYIKMMEQCFENVQTNPRSVTNTNFLDKLYTEVESASMAKAAQHDSGEKLDDHPLMLENFPLSNWAEIVVGKKEYGKLWVVIVDNFLSCWTSEITDGCPIVGPYNLKNTLFVGKNPSDDSIELHIRENFLCSHWTHLKLVSIADVEKWISNIVKCIMPKNDLLLYSLKNLSAGGNLWIRQGTACAWTSGWMFLDNHKLFYTLDNCSMLFELDIRKFIGMKSALSKVDWCASVVGSLKGPFLLLQEGGSLFVQAEHDSVTFTWINLLKHQMACSGYRLEDSKLTSDDVPVIVDKCIKFISTYGLLHPGLYRCSGSAIKVRALLSEFRKDPINLHLLPGSDDIINVVADVLRSFFRQLDSPLVPYHIQDRLFAVFNMKDSSRLDEYHEILMGLPRIRIQTLRRVLDHLKDVTEHANANLATVENIAKVFGPTLLSVQRDSELSSSFSGMMRQINLVKDLLTYYASIFRISAREMCIKSKINMLQEKPNQTKARADGFLVPVHILEKDNHTFNVQSSSNAEQVCDAARNRPAIRNETDVNTFALFEEIKYGQLERRVNPPEKMSSMITCRWLDWEPSECFLLFKRDPIPYSFQLSYPFADDVRIAEPGTKSYNIGHLKLEAGVVAYYNKNLKKVNQWHTDEILWYIGHEGGRKPPYPYTLTFILPKDHNFKYKSKYMGYCVAFREVTLRAQWLNAAVSSQHDFRENSNMPLLQI
ncbi:unnamed protein product [Thelazia callipaeda]|uniref:Rho-GAP domain-containing protein n=1 Tax=Thelazia callipaeda TaxID=103827 RepID=A0A158RCV9_THECL|nr:unnamed protein product [Thelazia callipaeda]